MIVFINDDSSETGRIDTDWEHLDILAVIVVEYKIYFASPRQYKLNRCRRTERIRFCRFKAWYTKN